MAGIDSSIYFQAKPADLFGSYQRGLEIKDQMDQRKLQEQQREFQTQVNQAYAGAVIQNPDGTTTFDQNKLQSNLGMLAGQNPLAVKSLQDVQGSIYDRQTAEKKFNADQDYRSQQIQLDRDRIKSDAENRAYTRNFDREKFDFEKSKALIDQQKKSRSGENLPLDQKKMVETLSFKNANKVAIQNQIDAVMSNWDNLSEDQQVAAGRQLLKTLNSTEGADAIGAEEAKRLGSKLEFAMGNFTNSNPTQFGRDLSGFAEQARNTSRGIGDAVKMNQNQINELMGRPTDPIGGKKPSWAL